MVRGKGRLAEISGNVLGPTEIENLNEQKAELEDVLSQKREYGKGTAAEQIDEASLRRQISRLDQAINSQPRLSDRQKDEAAKRLNEIEGIVSEGIPTRYEMDKPHKNPGAVRKHLEWSKRNAGLIDEHRRLKTMIGDYGRSIESLRKDR